MNFVHSTRNEFIMTRQGVGGKHAGQSLHPSPDFWLAIEQPWSRNSHQEGGCHCGECEQIGNADGIAFRQKGPVPQSILEFFGHSLFMSGQRLGVTGLSQHRADERRAWDDEGPCGPRPDRQWAGLMDYSCQSPTILHARKGKGWAADLVEQKRYQCSVDPVIDLVDGRDIRITIPEQVLSTGDASEPPADVARPSSPVATDREYRNLTLSCKTNLVRIDGRNCNK